MCENLIWLCPAFTKMFFIHHQNMLSGIQKIHLHKMSGYIIEVLMALISLISKLRMENFWSLGT